MICTEDIAHDMYALEWEARMAEGYPSKHSYLTSK